MYIYIHIHIYIVTDCCFHIQEYIKQVFMFIYMYVKRDSLLKNAYVQSENVRMGVENVREVLDILEKFQVLDISEKEPYVSTKEPYISAKQPYE